MRMRPITVSESQVAARLRSRGTGAGVHVARETTLVAVFEAFAVACTCLAASCAVLVALGVDCLLCGPTRRNGVCVFGFSLKLAAGPAWPKCSGGCGCWQTECGI